MSERHSARILELHANLTIRVPNRMIAGMRSGTATHSSSPFNGLLWGLRACVVALALFHFSENTSDPDLWGHVLFGQRMLALGHVETIEPFSWTAHGMPWNNHEVLAEVALGAAHRLAGGGGLLALKCGIGLLTFALALRLGGRHLGSGGRAVAWVLAGLSTVEIAFGFAARPQIFTSLGLILLLWMVTRVREGALRWTLLLPPLFLVWFNTHGGALLGLLLLFAAAGASALEWIRGRLAQGDNAAGRQTCTLILASIGSALTAFCTPWGATAPRWLIGSVAWSRPAIEEWNPTPFGWEHAPLFLLMALALAALLAAPRHRRGSLGSWIVLALLAVAALRHVRHAPLFALAAMALLPAPLSAALEQLGDRITGLAGLFESKPFRALVTSLMAITALAILAASPLANRNHRPVMEVPRDQYPISAIEFIKQNRIEGNLLVWFDWGEICLWELPSCPVSIDGRLDTCYPMSLIDAHWRFYAGKVETGPDLDIRQADLALLPVGLNGWKAVTALPGWQPVYRDTLAELWVRAPERFPELIKTSFPVQPSPEATAGRAPFPPSPPQGLLRSCE
jgi:hypothetical protein